MAVLEQLFYYAVAVNGVTLYVSVKALWHYMCVFGIVLLTHPCQGRFG